MGLGRLLDAVEAELRALSGMGTGSGVICLVLDAGEGFFHWRKGSKKCFRALRARFVLQISYKGREGVATGLNLETRLKV